jgi:hypothetical protein
MFLGGNLGLVDLINAKVALTKADNPPAFHATPSCGRSHLIMGYAKHF